MTRLRTLGWLTVGLVAMILLAGCGNPRGSEYNDCWVKIYDEENFTWDDDRAQIWGPGEFPTLNHMRDSGEDDWNNDIESIKVGPRARVILYADEGFRGPAISFGPGEHVPDLDAYDFGDRAESMRIELVDFNHHRH